LFREYNHSFVNNFVAIKLEDSLSAEEQFPVGSIELLLSGCEAKGKKSYTILDCKNFCPLPAIWIYYLEQKCFLFHKFYFLCPA